MIDTNDEIEKVKQAIARIPAGEATLTTSADEFEYRIEVVPKATDKCRFWIGFSAYGTYGLCFGNGLCFEDIPSMDFKPIDVVNAILNGQVEETVWRRGGNVIKSVGRIRLQDGRELSDTAVCKWLGFLPMGEKHEILYRSYF